MKLTTFSLLVFWFILVVGAGVHASSGQLPLLRVHSQLKKINQVGTKETSSTDSIRFVEDIGYSFGSFSFSMEDPFSYSFPGDSSFSFSMDDMEDYMEDEPPLGQPVQNGDIVEPDNAMFPALEDPFSFSFPTENSFSFSFSFRDRQNDVGDETSSNVSQQSGDESESNGGKDGETEGAQDLVDGSSFLPNHNEQYEAADTTASAGRGLGRGALLAIVLSCIVALVIVAAVTIAALFHLNNRPGYAGNRSGGDADTSSLMSSQHETGAPTV